MIDVELGKIVVVNSAQKLLAVRQVVPHRHDVILNVGKIEAHIAARSGLESLVATLRETLDDIRFATEQTQKRQDPLSAVADALQNWSGIFWPGTEDLIFNRVDILLNIMHKGIEAIDDVIDEGVCDPIGAELHVVAQFADAFEYVARVRIFVRERKAQETIAEDDCVNVDRLEEFFTVFVLVETSEGDEVILLEQFDLLSALLSANILASQRMYAKRLA